MKITPGQSRELLERFGCYVTEACDKCGQLLGSVRYMRRGGPGEWCSRECRGDSERTIVDLLFRGKPKPFPWLHEHHL
jgi:hypothetical protein